MDRKSILLVEDELIIAMNEKKNLENYGYSVVTVADGEKAIAYIDAHPEIDIVLMDLNLGEGVEGTKIAEMILLKHDLPLVFLSMHTEREVVEKTEGITFYGYVVKSSNIAVLDASIKMAFKLFDEKKKVSEKQGELEMTNEEMEAQNEELVRINAALIEARKKAEEHEAIYKMLYESSHDALFTSEIHEDGTMGNFIMVNDIACQRLGYTREELLAMSPRDINSEKAREGIVSRAKRTLMESHVTAEAEHVTKDGRIIPIEISYGIAKFGGKTYLHANARDISERKKAEKLLQDKLVEKEMLLKEVHHRIKNNLASIEGLLSIQQRAISDPEGVSALQSAINRVTSMRILYDKLLISGDYGEISVKGYIESLVDAIVASFQSEVKISVEKRASDFTMVTKSLFLLGIILNELLTNVMKYAFLGRNSGLIVVTLEKEENHVTLTVRDNGTGLPEGFDLDAAKGFGLMLVGMLVEQLDGAFSIQNNQGTVSVVRFDI